MNEAQARVDAIYARERAKAVSERDRNRAADPATAAVVDEFRRVFGKVHAVTVGGKRYGPAPLERVVPPRPPGLSLVEMEAMRGEWLANRRRK